MAVYTRTIGRISSAVPRWRTAMALADRIYYVNSTPPYFAPALDGAPSHYGYLGTAPNTYGAGWDVMSGYSSGTLLEDTGGTFGTMVYGTGGHGRLQNQILGLDLNQDDPSWSWWQAPTYKTSDSGGADLYYSPAEEAALLAGPRGTAARIRGNNEVSDAAAWDRRFPVAFDGWIFPRKLTTGQMGEGVPHGFRYSSTQYIPASVTGTDPMYFAITSAQGPFIQNALPAGVPLTDWFDPSALTFGNTLRRHAYYFRNCATGAWSMHKWQPDGMALAGSYSSPSIGVFQDTRRVYVVGGNANTMGYYYLDFSGGFAGHTVSTYFGGHVNRHGYCAGAFSDRDPLGRHFMVTLSNEQAHTSKIVVYDFDRNESYRVDLAAYGFTYGTTDERVGISWDAANRRVLLVMAHGPTWQPYYWSIKVPDVLSNPAGWSASKRMLTMDDPEMGSNVFVDQSSLDRLAGFYGKTRLHPKLGVILIPSGLFRMMGFVPSA